MSHADEFVSLAWDADLKARKAHECDACGQAIEPGHYYKRWFTVFEGEPSVTKQCWRCYLVWVAIVDRSGNDEAVLFGLDCDVDWLDAFGQHRNAGDSAYIAGGQVLGYMPPHVEALAFALPGECAPEGAP